VRSEHVIEVEASVDPVWCEADENQIRQIVWNLASNGIRAMAQGGRLTLAVRSEEIDGNRMVVLTVQDQGCGIAPDDLDGIFQPFRSSFERGTGLGLAIVHRLVTDYHGAVQVSSEVGVGTIFTVRLPVDAGITATDNTNDALRQAVEHAGPR
jgi:signal transduction histidine kinase